MTVTNPKVTTDKLSKLMNFNKSLDTQNQMQFFIYHLQLGNGISKVNYVGKHPKTPHSNPRNKSNSKY